MKSITAYTVVLGLVVSALYCFQPATAGGTLSFLSLYSYTSVYGDDNLSGYISTNGGFPFGTGSVYGVYVATNGYIGMSSAVSSYDIPGGYTVVVPYGADLDPSEAGTVRYTAFSSDYSQLNAVSSFIRSQSSNYFYGTRMMIAEWNGVPRFSGPSYTTVSFQAVLITDGTSSYAVFIYECVGMEWGGATIGWQYSSSLYREHYLSGSSSASIGCQYSSTYSAIVYRLDPDCDYDEFTCDNGNCEPASYECDGVDDCGPGDNSDEEYCFPSPSPIPTSSYCYSYQWQCDNGECIYSSSVCNGYYDCGDYSDEIRGCGATSPTPTPTSYYCDSSEFQCDNGDCVPGSYECDDYNDCGDNSDEENCGGGSSESSSSSSTSVGLAVGLSMGILFLIAFVAVPVCAVTGVYVIAQRKSQAARLHTVATTPATTGAGSTTAAASSDQTNETSFATPQTTHPTQHPPPPQQHSAHQDAQLSCKLPPPSYDSAVAFPTYTPQRCPQYQSNPVAGYPPHYGYPQAAPYPNAGYPPPNQAPVPQSDGATGVILQQ